MGYLMIPNEIIGFFNLPKPFSRAMALGSEYQECSWVGKGRPARKAGKLIYIGESII
jgi:hypothetical protein